MCKHTRVAIAIPLAFCLIVALPANSIAEASQGLYSFVAKYSNTASGVVKVEDYDLVNIRGGPGINYSIRGSLRKGESAIVIAKSKDSKWWQIEWGQDRNNWISAEYVKFYGDAANIPVSSTETRLPLQSPLSTTTVSPTSTKIKIEFDFVNIRNGPGTTYPIRGQLRVGDSASVIGKSTDGEWVQIEWQQESILYKGGWVSIKFVKFYETASIIPVTETTQTTTPSNSNASQSSSGSQSTASNSSTTTIPKPPTSNSASVLRNRYGAICRDGSTSQSTGRGACSHHGGVSRWLYSSP